MINDDYNDTDQKLMNSSDGDYSDSDYNDGDYILMLLWHPKQLLILVVTFCYCISHSIQKFI